MKTYGTTYEEYSKSLLECESDESWQGYIHFAPLIRANLSKILEVDGFIDRFHETDPRVQMTILKTISNGYCVHATFLWLRLFLELNISYKELVMESSCSEPSPKFFTGFNIDPYEASYLYQFLSKLKDRIWSSTNAIQYSRQIMLMLMLTIPKKTLYEVVYRWISDKAVGGIADFALVAENWESVKDIPLDWAIQTVGTAHDCDCVKNKKSKYSRPATR